MPFWVIPVLIGVFALSAVRPSTGVVFFTVLLPLEAILPSSLAADATFLRSPIAVAGAIAGLGSGLGLMVHGRLKPHAIFSSPVNILGLAFIAWMFVTHPDTSWSGEDRNWILTFLQLWTLMVVAGAAVATPREHKIVMVCFGAACLFSAHDGITSGALAATRDAGVRASGYVLGVNTSARYFVTGMIFFLYLRMSATQWWAKALALAAAGYLAVGVVFTQSRGGVLLAILSVIFVPLFGARQAARRVLVNAAAVVVIAFMLLPRGAVDSIESWFSPEQAESSTRLDSVDDNIRYALWDAGIAVWKQNPVTGVGVGGFGRASEEYLPPEYTSAFYTLNTHSMFIGLLSQTGVGGLALFGAMLWVSGRRAWSVHVRRTEGGLTPAAVWLLVVGMLAIGAIFKDDTAEKVLWLAMGMAGSVAYQTAAAAPARIARTRRVAPTTAPSARQAHVTAPAGLGSFGE